MPFVDARLGPGLLTLGTPGVDHGPQISAVTLTPAVDSVDGTPTLAVPDPPPETNTSYTLDGSAINDFTSAAGLQRYAFDNDGDEIAFVLTTSSVSGEGATFTGTCVVRAFPMGGNVGEQLVTDFSWPVVGKPVIASSAARAAAGKGGDKA